MNRLAAVVLLLFLEAGCAPDPSQRALDPRPNVLLITLDTLRADCLGCYGSPDVKTPAIDRLAGEGVRFTRAVAPSQCTNPSHASIMTGLYLAEHGVYDNTTPLADEALTLAERLSGESYLTIGAVSARHLNPRNANLGQGFDTFLRCRPPEMDAGTRNRQLFKELRNAAHRPFFAWVHYFDPHGPYDPPAPYDHRYPPGERFDPVPPQPWMDIAEHRRGAPLDPDELIALYKGEISYLDREIGRLFALLDELGQSNRTLVVLVADHGESMTEKGIYFCHAGLYNQVLHVPLIIRWPGSLPAGLAVDTMVSPVDILPTILDLLELSPSGAMSGVSLVPVVEGSGLFEARPLFSEAVNGVIRAVHVEDYKFIKAYPGKDWSVTRDHLYRPFEDYDEAVDLLSDQPGQAGQLDRLRQTCLERVAGERLPSRRRERLDRVTEEALRQLGYLE